MVSHSSLSRHHPRQEPCAVIPPAGICEGAAGNRRPHRDTRHLILDQPQNLAPSLFHSPNTRTPAPAGVMAGALPPHPRDFPLWGRQHGGADIRHNMPTAETSDTMLAPPWRIGQLRRRNPSAIGGAPRHGRRLRTPPAFFLAFAQDVCRGETPPPCWRPNAQNLGGTGAEPLSSPPPAKLSLHFLWWPVCQPRVAAGRLGASGGWRHAARPASQQPPIGRFAGWRGGRGFALSCLATDCLTRLPMAGILIAFGWLLLGTLIISSRPLQHSIENSSHEKP
jgi:hypothetical protein